jgi:glucose/arabinose dehydrogenase
VIPGRAVASAALVALLLTAGCGGSDDSTTNAPAPSPPPSAGVTRPGERPPRQPVGDGSGGVELTRLGDFDSPLYVAQPPGREELFVVEQTGAVRVIDQGEAREDPFLDLGDRITTAGSEQGLLSVAFAPDYASSGLLYVDYTDTNGDTRVVEYRRSRADPLRADPDSARELLFVDQPFSNHNGGLLLFGPDGDLYVGLGDGGSGGDPERNGQDLSTLLGKILRIDPRPAGGGPYGIPADNPFLGLEGARPEIYVYGARNPWRFSFDRRTGALLVADVGQSEFEEVDFLPAGEAAGANLGWSAFEGIARFNTDQEAPGAVRPILTYGRDRGCAITGGYVVRDPALRSLYGRYLYGDYCEGQLRSLIPSAGRARDDKPLGLEVPALTSFGEDNAGHIYITSQEGPVYRLDPAP